MNIEKRLSNAYRHRESRFKALFPKRLDKVSSTIKSLKKLSNKTNYVYDQVEIYNGLSSLIIEINDLANAFGLDSSEMDPTDSLYSEIKEINIKPQVDRFEFKDGHSVILLSRGRLVNLGNATGHPSFVMSNSFTNQVLAQIALWNGDIVSGVNVLPKDLDEEVARLHLDHLDAKLTTMSDEQSEYTGIKKEGPFKSKHYRY